MHYLIEHTTQLSFAEPVREHHCELRVAPAERPEQIVRSFEITTDPPAELGCYTDAFGNLVHHFSVMQPHDRLTTRVKAVVDTRLDNPFDFPLMPPDREPDWMVHQLRTEPRLWDYVLHRSPSIPEEHRLRAAGLELPTRDPLEPLMRNVQNASEWVREILRYQAEATGVHAPLLDVVKGGAGVCQDFAHLLIVAVRSWGYAARYAMGYQDVSDDEDEEEEEASTPAQVPHAWCEVLLPNGGWRGFDPVSGLIANDTYVVVAIGRDSVDAAPQRGSFKGEDTGDAPEVTLRMARQEQ